MSYTPTEWQTGDIVTSEKLNHIEEGIKSSLSADLIINAQISEYYEDDEDEEPDLIVECDITPSDFYTFTGNFYDEHGYAPTSLMILNYQDMQATYLLTYQSSNFYGNIIRPLDNPPTIICLTITPTDDSWSAEIKTGNIDITWLLPD